MNTMRYSITINAIESKYHVWDWKTWTIKRSFPIGDLYDAEQYVEYLEKQLDLPIDDTRIFEYKPQAIK